MDIMKKLKEMQIGERIKEILTKVEIECINSCYKIDTNENYIKKLRENIFKILKKEMKKRILKQDGSKEIISKTISKLIISYMEDNGFKINQTDELKDRITTIVDDSLKSIRDIRNEMITQVALNNYNWRMVYSVPNGSELQDWLFAENEIDKKIRSKIGHSLRQCKILLDITYDQIMDEIIAIIEDVFVEGCNNIERNPSYVYEDGYHLQYSGLIGESKKMMVNIIKNGRLRNIIKQRLEEEYIKDNMVSKMIDDIIIEFGNNIDQRNKIVFISAFRNVMMDILSKLCNEEHKLIREKLKVSKNYNEENIRKEENEVCRYINHLLFPNDRKFYPKLDRIMKAEIEYRPNGIGYLSSAIEFNNLQKMHI